MHPPSVNPAPLPANLVYDLASIVEPLDLGHLFPLAQPLEIELGSGDGSFLLAYAQQHPEWNFIGVERLLGRIRKLDRKGRRLGLRNLRGVRIECAYFLEYLLPAHTADALHIYFPDPWPKKKHRKYRLVGDRFPSLSQRALKPAGCVHLRTDDTDYFEQMTAVFGAAAEFQPAETPVGLADIVTDFEKDFLAEGKATCRATYQLKS
jgi:tRNA (guanine-N7-)-methyltransferase